MTTTTVHPATVLVARAQLAAIRAAIEVVELELEAAGACPDPPSSLEWQIAASTPTLAEAAHTLELVALRLARGRAGWWHDASAYAPSRGPRPVSRRSSAGPRRRLKNRERGAPS